MKTIQEIYQLFDPTCGVTTDSRNVKPQQLFFALKGPNFDANLFARQALKLGAKAAIVDNPDIIPNNDERYLLVDNCLTTLQQLASLHRQTLGTTIIQITGTNGKTTTKELLSTVLRTTLNVVATQGNLNNHIGVPLTLLQLQTNTQIAVIETGANHPGEIQQLTNIVQPQYGIITNIQKAHLEGFKSYTNIIKTKTALYNYLRRTHGTIFYNAADPLLCRLSQGTNRIPYSPEPVPNTTSPFCCVNWQETTIKTQLVGNYNAPNIAAALAVGTHFGVPEAELKKAIENYTPQLGRSQIIHTERNTIILDAYNANPSSMKVALNNFFNLSALHKVLILGQMNELGITSLQQHQAIINLIQQHLNHNLQAVLLIGNNFTTCNTHGLPLITLNDLPNLNNCTILIKGSNSNHLDKLVNQL